MFAALGAAAALASAGAGIYSASQAGRGGSVGYDTSVANLEESRNQQRYNQLLNALALQRSVAGYSDSQGSTVSYDPGSNTWRSILGDSPQRVQQAKENASVERNTTDMAMAREGNRMALSRAQDANSSVGPAHAALENFRPMSAESLIAALTERATTANREATTPLIQDTLRSFARTGTSAGPVLSEIGRQSSSDLRKALIDSQIAGLTNVDQINNTRRSGLIQDFQARSAAANPSFNFPGIDGSDPNAQLAAVLADRSKTSTQAPLAAAGIGAQGQYATNQAAKMAIDQSPNPNQSGINIASIGKQLPNLVSSTKDLWNAITSPSSNQADQVNANRQDWQLQSKGVY